MFRSKLWQDRLLSIISAHSQDSVGQLRAIGNFEKMSGNLNKHEVSFDEASSCIISTKSILLKDKLYNVRIEPRFNLIALSDRRRILFVVFCVRDKGTQKRIISARCANKSERSKLLAKFPDVAGTCLPCKVLENSR